MIRPLTEERACISQIRSCAAAWQSRIAQEHAYRIKKRVLRLYYIFLAHGTIQLKRKALKPKREEQKKIFAAAIERYYLSAKRPSLRDAYDCLLLERCLRMKKESSCRNIRPGTVSASIITAVGCTKRAHEIIAREELVRLSAQSPSVGRLSSFVEGSPRQLSDGCNTGRISIWSAALTAHWSLGGRIFIWQWIR